MTVDTNYEERVRKDFPTAACHDMRDVLGLVTPFYAIWADGNLIGIGYTELDAWAAAWVERTPIHPMPPRVM